MDVETVTMYDTINQSAGNIPASALKVAGYVTGTPNILWTPAKWALFKDAGLVKIDQSPSLADFANGTAAVADVEAGAGTNSGAAIAIHTRQEKNLESVVYCNAENVDDLVAALHDKDVNLDDVYIWLANWNLDEKEAAALIGTVVSGLYVVAVQWASPSSNPNTPVPGRGGNLLDTNLDLSVAQRTWIPDPSYVEAQSGPQVVYADGGQSLIAFAKAHNITPVEVIWTTVKHHTEPGPDEVAYFNSGNLAANMPEGMAVWRP